MNGILLSVSNIVIESVVKPANGGSGMVGESVTTEVVTVDKSEPAS